MKKIVFLILLYSCLLTVVQGQSRQSDGTRILKKVSSSIESIQSLRGKLLVQITTNEPNVDSLIFNLDIDFTMQRQREDSIVGWNFGSKFTNRITPNELSCDHYYRGNNYFYTENKWSKSDAKSAKSSILISIVKGDFFKCVTEWLDGKTRSSADFEKQYGYPFSWKVMQSKDTVIDGKKCFVFIGTNRYKQSSGQVNTREIRMLIWKKEYIPILVESFAESRDAAGTVISAQRGRCYIKQLTINPTISEEEFLPSVDTTDIPLYEIPSPLKMLNVGDKTPKWELLDVDGKHYRSEELNGKVCFVLFSTSTCGWCTLNNKRVKEAYEMLKERNDVVFIMINPVDQGERAKRYAAQYPFPVLVDNGDIVTSQFGVVGYPASFIIGKDGIIEECYPGYNDTFTKEVFLEAILKVVNKKK